MWVPIMTDARLNSKAALSTLVIFEIFAIGISLLFIYAAVVRHAGWDGAIIGITLCVAVYVWWQSFSVAIDEFELRYRSLFSRKVIALRQITRAVRKIELVSQGTRPPNRIEIYGTVDGNEVQFDINVKPFPLSDVKKMEQMLRAV